jgi:hypothetical protein
MMKTCTCKPESTRLDPHCPIWCFGNHEEHIVPDCIDHDLIKHERVLVCSADQKLFIAAISLESKDDTDAAKLIVYTHRLFEDEDFTPDQLEYYAETMLCGVERGRMALAGDFSYEN